MKTDCLLRPKNHVKLSPLASTPNIDDLKQLIIEVQKTRNCSIELPWAVDMIRFALDVRINLGTQELIWTLYQGDGLQSHVVWNAPFSDIYLLREVIAISISEIVLEHKQAKLIANSKEQSLESKPSPSEPFASTHVPMGLDMPDDSQQNGGFGHSYRTVENSLASVADMVNQRVARTEQTTVKTNGTGKEQLLNIAEETINKAGESISKAEKSINKAEKSINQAEKSINQAEKSINRAEHIIENMSETTALASTILHSVAKKTVSEMVETTPQSTDKDKNKSTAQPPPSPYAYVYPGTTYAVPVTYPIPIAGAPPVNAVPMPIATQSVAATGFPLTAQPVSNAGIPLPIAGSFPFQAPNQSLNSVVNPGVSSIRLAPTDERMLDKQTKFLLGQFLVESRLVPEKTLDTALKLQKMVGGNVISKEQAIDTISRVHFRNGNFDMVQLMKNSTTGGNKVNSSDFPLLGELLVKAAVIDDQTLQVSLKMQEVVRAGAMSKDKACEILQKEFTASGRTNSNAVKAEQLQEQNVIDLLIEAGLINKEDKKTVQDVQTKFGGKTGEILVSAHKLSQIAYDAAVECERLICQNKIKLEESIIALNYCERSRVTLPDAIQELGFQIAS